LASEGFAAIGGIDLKRCSFAPRRVVRASERMERIGCTVSGSKRPAVATAQSNGWNEW
jgi:hypothetical protein